MATRILSISLFDVLDWLATKVRSDILAFQAAQFNSAIQHRAEAGQNSTR